MGQNQYLIGGMNMDNNYIKALNIVENTLYKINSIYDNASTESFEARVRK
jgi:hypothetical protein